MGLLNLCFWSRVFSLSFRGRALCAGRCLGEKSEVQYVGNLNLWWMQKGITGIVVYRNWIFDTGLRLVVAQSTIGQCIIQEVFLKCQTSDIQIHQRISPITCRTEIEDLSLCTE